MKNKLPGQPRSRRYLLWLIPLLIVALLYLLGVAADAWLESAGGRRLVENALGDSLGAPVHLNGDYRFRLLPRLAVNLGWSTESCERPMLIPTTSLPASS